MAGELLLDTGALVSLLDKYADLPMDFADATIVALAEELDCSSVFRRTGRTFRSTGSKAGSHFASCRTIELGEAESKYPKLPISRTLSVSGSP